MPDDTLRIATHADVPRLVELMQAFYAEAGVPLETDVAAASFDALLSQPAYGAVWIAEWAGAPAGYVALAVTFSMEYGGLAGFVDDLFIVPAARGHGIGRRALEVLVAECRRRSLRAVHVEVAPENDIAQSLYRSFDFREKPGRQWLTVDLGPPRPS